MQEYGLVSPEGSEPLFFVPPRAQTNKTGTYAQQVVTRVVGYSWCLAHAWHTLGTRLGFAEPARIFHYAFGLLETLTTRLPVAVVAGTNFSKVIRRPKEDTWVSLGA